MCLNESCVIVLILLYQFSFRIYMMLVVNTFIAKLYCVCMRVSVCLLVGIWLMYVSPDVMSD